MRYIDPSVEIKGWLQPISGATIQLSLLGQQNQLVEGHLLEIGVYLGKSLAHLGFASNEKELVIGVDPFTLEIPGSGTHDCFSDAKKNLEIAKIKYNFRGKLILLRGESGDKNIFSYLMNYQGKFRAISIDGSHFHKDVFNDLCLANRLLHENGIIILDDFCSPLNPEVTTALREFLINSTEGSLWKIAYAIAPMCSPLQGASRVFLQRKSCSINYYEIIERLICEVDFSSIENDFYKYTWVQISFFDNHVVPTLLAKRMLNWQIC